MLTLNDGRKELYQWDTGRTATVDIECDVVHFANLKYGESLAVEVKVGKVAIPNKLLMSGEPIYCWAFVTDESGAYTKKEQDLNVIKRAKPSDYVYTETEVITIQTAVRNALQEAKESGDFDGSNGKSAYELAVANGYVGSEMQWLESLHGADGVSPTVATDAIAGGTKVTITDKDGAHEFNVMNGSDVDIAQTTGDSEIAVMSQKATTVEINALKNNLSDKLPKSPANWEQWTADEQAVARERIGINNDAELVERITLSESVSSVVREYDTAGVEYNFKAMRIRIINTSGSIITASVLANGVSLTYCQIQNNAYAPILLDCSSGLLNVVSTITTNTDDGARLSIMPRVRTIGYPMKSFKKIKIDGTLSAGTEIEIYGVRA